MTQQSELAANPVLAEFVRGNMVENRHRGSFCLVDNQGNVLASAGNIEALIYPRSAIKSLQALALFESGAVEKFGLEDRDLALACASHLGEEFHVAGVQSILEKIGMTSEALECGSHLPTNKLARKALLAAGAAPTPLHNNCSGKHAGMLAVAKAINTDPSGYIERDHPVQVLVRNCVEQVLDVALTSDSCGRDGCSIPTWGAPLKSFAAAFAKLSAGSNELPEAFIKPGTRLFGAAANNAEMIAGTGGFDTDVMNAYEGELMIKVGAAGVFCGALRSQNLGFALKCDDGDLSAAHAMVAALLKQATKLKGNTRAALNKQLHQVSKNWRGFEVGHMQAADGFSNFF